MAAAEVADWQIAAILTSASVQNTRCLSLTWTTPVWTISPRRPARAPVEAGALGFAIAHALDNNARRLTVSIATCRQRRSTVIVAGAGRGEKTTDCLRHQRR
ncbi:hypothetical protein ACNKHQ_13605 [Shigella flexneri]